MFWLDPNSVPTMGDYFRAGGYRTFYRGKWHVSYADIQIPGTHNGMPSYNSATGEPDPYTESFYSHADRLDAYGFSGWIGPEPHGINPRNSGSSAAAGLPGRDQVYADEVVRLIGALDREQRQAYARPEPWLIVASFVNPHDIALFGEFTRIIPAFHFAVDPTVPDVPAPPTLPESLNTKPRCQRSYREVYPLAFQPTANTGFYRRLYYQLQYNADEQMLKVLQSLRESSFYEDTVVIFTSDHGDLLGSHGGLHQKWYTAYEEAIRVPLIIHNPKLFDRRESVAMPTSHVDLLPTMLGLAGIDPGEVQSAVQKDHTEVHPLVGRNLCPLIGGKGTNGLEEPVYFMTDDDVTRSEKQVNALGIPYEPVVQPNSIETVIVTMPARGRNVTMLWKYSRYFDNPQFWSAPGVLDKVQHLYPSPAPFKIGPQWGHADKSVCLTTIKTVPVPEEFELYNLTVDPMETTNLAHPEHATAESRQMQARLAVILQEQCRKKRLSPASGPVPGMPSCGDLT